MTTFPGRPLRDEFGPDPVDRFPVRDPEKELGANIGRAMFHQVTGLGLLSRLASLSITLASSGDMDVINWRREAWNTKNQTTGNYAAPTFTRTGTGVATLTYSANLPDHTGALVPIVFGGGGGYCTTNDGNVYEVRVIPASPVSNVVTIKTFIFSAGLWTPSDGTFNIWLE